MSSINIHPTAIVEQGAELDVGVTVGAYSVIGRHVKIGKNTQIHHHVNLQGHTTLGEQNEVYSFASVGNPPQDLKFKGEKTLLVIGNKNIIREYVTMQPGTAGGGGQTLVGDENLFMAYTHVAHDCTVGNRNVFANGAQLAGHVIVQDMAVLGGLSAVHQFCVLGDMCMLAGGTMAKQDIPPYCLADGFRAVLRGLNVVAMQRRGVSAEARTALKNAYKMIFLNNFPTIDESISQISPSDLQYAEVQKFVKFIQVAKRGVTRPPKIGNNELDLENGD